MVQNGLPSHAGTAATDVKPVTAAARAGGDSADFSGTSTFANNPTAIKTSPEADESRLEDRTTADSQQHVEPAYASDVGASAPDSAHSKRSIAGLGLDQPGSASKRFRSAESDSPVNKLTQNFEGLSTGKAAV